MIWVGYVLYSIYVASSLWLLAGAFAQLHLLWHSRKKLQNGLLPAMDFLPFVSIQVPVYNEKYVIQELLESLTRLDYPQRLLQIQVLDDSTDETSLIIDQQVAKMQKRGFLISVLRRDSRQGYKAGALQHGLLQCKGELIAIFDVDFRPPAGFINSLIPHFRNPRIGLVQARWGHINTGQNFLTRIQSYLLDMHFTVEQQGRYQAGYFTNFCGTAGIWRKACIMDAGGWDGNVLSEDLDLSYRAQLKGWLLSYDNDVIVPAELPSEVEAFKIQQFRWTKGMAQVAKKTMPQLLRTQLPLAKKLHGIVHLLGSFTFVCLFINALLTVPLLQLRQQYPEYISLTNYSLVGAINLIALAFLYYRSAEPGPQRPFRFLLNYPVFVVVYLAMSVQNAIAVLQGFAGMQSPFVRTPKSNGASPKNTYQPQTISWLTWLETALLIYFVYGIGLSVYYNDFFLLFFFVLICSGLIILLYPGVQFLSGNWTKTEEKYLETTTV